MTSDIEADYAIKCRLFPYTERCKYTASLHSTYVQLCYTGVLLILFDFTVFSE
jgi:hypothetical protein